jgi:hypothetical protein
MPADVQNAANHWRDYRTASHGDLACTVSAAHLLASHTMYPQLLCEDVVAESPMFEQLGIFPDRRKDLLAKRDQVRTLAGI